MMPSPTDEQLIARLMQGERAALAPLVERYHGPLLAYLYRLANGDRPLAEDLVQDTYVHLLQQRSYQPGRPVRPWLYAIATHLAYDHFRSPAVRRARPLDDPAQPEPADDAPGPEELAQLAGAARQVAAALGRLSPEYRAALLLRYYAGHSLLEISQALDIPLGTVKSRLSVGTRRLRHLLLPEEENSP
jgi:RNA polymerase sigma-70 factor (ECF subfamily)